MSRLELKLFGPPKIYLEGQPCHIPDRRAQALLYVLTVEPGDHSREELAELLWSEQPLTTPELRAKLSRALSTLQRQLEPSSDRYSYTYVIAERDHLRFNTGADYYLDVAEFRKLTNPRPLSTIGKSEADHLHKAVQLYSGPFLDHFYLGGGGSLDFEHWCNEKRAELTNELLATLQDLSLYHARRQEYGAAILVLEPHVPLFESEFLHLLLVLLYATVGKLHAAVDHRDRMSHLGFESTPAMDELCDAIASGRLIPRDVQTALEDTLANVYLSEADAARLVHETLVVLGFRQKPSWGYAVRSILKRARQLARVQGFSLTGTPHVFLALLEVQWREGVGRSFEQIGLQRHQIAGKIRYVLGENDGVADDQVALTARCEHVLARSREIAEFNGVIHVEPQHLLWAILEDEKGMVVRVLECLGADLPQLMRLLP